MKTNLWPEPSSITNITDHQRSTVTRSLAGPFGLLCGVPGAGKTYTAAAIVRTIIAEQGVGSVGVCAPTGKAAVRITEGLQANGIAMEATTIHRLLGVNRAGYDGKGWGFSFGPSRPLPYRYILVDEPSMLDCSLASSLFSACSPGTHVLLTGDPNQLPPVGAGAPLRDFIAAGLPCGTLTEIKRNSGTITEACKAIREGRKAIPDARISIGEGKNWMHLEKHRAALAMEAIKSTLLQLPGSVDPIWDCQILCAINEKGEVSRKELNANIQDVLNPNGKSVGGKFRIGDKVICGTNVLLEIANHGGNGTAGRGNPREFAHETSAENPKEFVANGEIGRVVAQHFDHRNQPKGFLVKFDAPARTVISTQTGEACVFDLAYAITIHKAQGSQARIVIVAIDDAANHMGSRELHYTAISRAEQMVITVGKLETLHRQCRRSELAGRKTFMAEGLKGKVQP